MGLLSSFTRLSRIKKGAVLMALVILIYAIFGFIVAPSILESNLISGISKHLGRKAVIDNVKVNPFALSVTVVGFEMNDPNGEKFAAFKELFINFQLSSIFRRAYTFDEIRLNSPDIRVKILPDKKLNFSDLLTSSGAPESENNQSVGIFPIQIARLRLDQGRILFSDLSRRTPYENEIFPIKISADNFSTHEGSENPYAFTASSSEGGLIRWEGSFSVNPLHSKGRFALTDFNRRLLYEYFQDQVRFDMSRGSANFSGQYVMDARGEDVHFELIDVELKIAEFNLTEKGDDKSLISIPLLSVKQAGVNFTKKEAVIGSVSSRDARLEGWLTPDGVVNYQALFAAEKLVDKEDTSSPTTDQPDGENRPWQVVVKELKLDNYEVLFEDQTPVKPVRFLLKPLNIHLKNMSNQKNAQFEVKLNSKVNQTGDISIQGFTRIAPVSVDLDVQVRGLNLPAFQPYVDAFAQLDVVSGAAGLDGRITYRNMGVNEPEFRYKGMANIDEFEADNRLHHDDFLKWASLSINDITLDISPGRLNIEEIVAKQPYARVIIWPDRTINVANMFVSEKKEPASDEPKEKKSFPITIHRVLIDNGSANFDDRSLKPNFATGIHEMNGSIKGLSSESLARADVFIQGKVDRYAPVKIAGQINPLSEDKYTDLELYFKNIELTTFTPYSGKFGGYQVEKGKLSLDLKYKLSKNILIGENEIFLNQLTLGDHVDSPRATSLPVRLAVALLKDSKGNIDINLPVRGDLDDPEFSFGHIILKALVNLITKIVTSPFAVLGSIIGGDGEELSFIEFEFGKTVLGDDQAEKLDNLAQALNERPTLGLEIKGTSDRASDWSVLAEAALIHQLKGSKMNEMRGAGQPLPTDIEAFALSDEDYNRLLIQTYMKKFAEHPKERFGTESKKIDPGKGTKTDADKSSSVDSAKSSTDIDAEMLIVGAKKRLIKEMSVDEAKLHQLAIDRSKQIRNYLIEKGKMSDERLFIVDVEILETTDDEMIRTNLKLSEL